MKYVILIHSNPESRRLWAGFSDAEKQAGWEYYAALDAELAASGELIVSEALDEAATAKQIAVRDGVAMATDGPFAEVKEHLAGFYLLECASLERAVQIAGRIPEAELGLVEVRPVINLGPAPAQTQAAPAQTQAATGPDLASGPTQPELDRP